MQIIGLLGYVLGPIMAAIFGVVKNYFLTIFLFTFFIRLLLFPISLKQQKSQMDRAKIAPRLERLQKKYANDRQKLAQKQQELYEQSGVSMTAGCLPMLLSFVVLMGVIATIYSPLSYLASPKIPSEVISVAEQAVIGDGEGKLQESMLSGYYGELRLMLSCDEGTNRQDIINLIDEPSLEALQRAYGSSTVTEENYAETLAEYKESLGDKTGAEYYEQIYTMSREFAVGSLSLLQQPWNNGFAGINLLWLIPLLSGLTSLAVSFLSMHYTKRSMPQNQPGQGCSNYSMLIMMPLFSTWIAFTVPGAVGIYWTFSNLISLLQTVVLNKIYNPAKARAEAEAEYEARRQKRAEDKKRLAQARQREEAEARKAAQEQELLREQSREENKKKKGNAGVAPTKNPNKLKAQAEKAAEKQEAPTEEAAQTPETDEKEKDGEN